VKPNIKDLIKDLSSNREIECMQNSFVRDSRNKTLAKLKAFTVYDKKD